MLSSTHSLVGASAGKFIRNPILAFGAGIILHFIFDKIPHFWPGQKKYENLILMCDTISTILIVAFFIFFPGIQNRGGVVGGALGGAVIDLFLVLMPETKETKLAEWHSKRQVHLRKFRFILNDILVMIVAAAIIFWP